MENRSQNSDSTTMGDGENKIRAKGSPEESEKKLLDCVNNGDLETVRLLLAEGVRVDCFDEHGMTPLQHAAYKGHSELCELFLSHGADVNANAHEHGYTALMFAALSGKKDAVRVLLENGACVGLENSVHRTAAQMAAFVGQHEIVSLINNFFSREDLEYYCHPRGLETEPKLPPALLQSLYRFVLIVNLNPVRLSLYLRQNVELLNNSDCVTRVLDLLCEKMMKQRETNEVLALKFCYMSYVIKQASQAEKQKASAESDVLGQWIRYLLRVRESDGIQENQECLVRSMLKEFPYVECQLLQQVVRTITSPTEVTAVNVLISCINGQRFASSEDKVCSTCGELNAKTCQVCKSVWYCNKECQKYHWFIHKKQCKALAEAYRLQQEAGQIESVQEQQSNSRQQSAEETSKEPVTEEDVEIQEDGEGIQNKQEQSLLAVNKTAHSSVSAAED